jgi:EAL domain-containing protein (putative c-di-GMP-specific phosphodiesterase class I)
MQALLLRQYGCRAYQGFLYGRPMPPDAFEAWLSRTATAPKELRA